MKFGFASCALLAGLIISPAMGSITVGLEPAGYTARIYADIPLADGIVGYGLDVSVGCPDLTFTGFTPGPLFDAVASTPDGDGIAGFVLPPSVIYGEHVLLGTLAFAAAGGSGGGWITLGYTASDPTEGFALPTVGQFADATFQGIWCPEPAGLIMLALGVFTMRRR